MFRPAHSVRIFSFLFSFALLAGATSLFAQERDPKIDLLADDLAHQLRKVKAVKERHGAPVFYLVFDFTGSSGRVNELGIHLADQVSEAMSNRIPGLSPIPRAKLRELCDLEKIDGNALASDPAARWAATSLGASLAIVGSVDLQGGEFNLRVRVLDHQLMTVAGASQHLEWTDERRGWEKPISARPPPASRFAAAHAGARGVSVPVCVYCPNPSYTEEARKVRFSGEVVAQVLLGPDGAVSDVSPLRGLPYGLTAQAVATLRNWKFKPATGPDGNPMTVEFAVEVNFRIK